MSYPESQHESGDAQASGFQVDHPHVTLLGLVLLKLLDDLALGGIEYERNHFARISMLDFETRTELLEVIQIKHYFFSDNSVCAACVCLGCNLGFISGVMPRSAIPL